MFSGCYTTTLIEIMNRKRYQGSFDDDLNGEEDSLFKFKTKSTDYTYTTEKLKVNTAHKNDNCRVCTKFQNKLKPFTTKDDSLQKEVPNQVKKDCPPDIEELGRNTWSFLHTMAAYYPENPSGVEQKDMTSFINLFSKFYPCEHCAVDFKDSIKKIKPDVTSRNSLSEWLCKQHNIVNEKLGKPIFDCTKVFQRWKDGWEDGSCDF